MEQVSHDEGLFCGILLQELLFGIHYIVMVPLYLLLNYMNKIHLMGSIYNE
jgi:hypothetical protein